MAARMGTAAARGAETLDRGVQGAGDAFRRLGVAINTHKYADTINKTMDFIKAHYFSAPQPPTSYADIASLYIDIGLDPNIYLDKIKEFTEQKALMREREAQEAFRRYHNLD